MGRPTRRALLQGFYRGAAALAITGRGQALAQAMPLIVVVNKDSRWQDISVEDLRALFSGEAVQLPGGQKAMPLNDFAGNPVRIDFDRRVLRMGPEEIGRYWTDRRIRGVSGPPRAVASAVVRQQLVARFSQAVTYLRQSELTEHARPITISGRRPGSSGYALALELGMAHRRRIG